MDEIVKDFLIESNENLDRLDQELVKLESSPSSKELLASVFRTIHTIKGSCGFLGFARVEKLAHAGESLLSRLRDGQLTLTADITSGLLAMVDAVRQMLSPSRHQVRTELRITGISSSIWLICSVRTRRTLLACAKRLPSRLPLRKRSKRSRIASVRRYGR